MSDDEMYVRAREELRYLEASTDGSVEDIESALDAGEKAEGKP